MNRVTGVVTRLGDKGYGWITGDDGVDYFFHSAQFHDPVMDFDKATEAVESGAVLRVEFLGTKSAKGPVALHVTIVREGGGDAPAA